MCTERTNWYVLLKNANKDHNVDVTVSVNGGAATLINAGFTAVHDSVIKKQAYPVNAPYLNVYFDGTNLRMI